MSLSEEPCRKCGTKTLWLNNSEKICSKCIHAVFMKLLDCVRFYADVNNWENPGCIKDPDHKAAKTLQEFGIK